MEQKTENESPEDPCSQTEMELKMSVTIRRDAFKNFDDADWGEHFLQEIVFQATKLNKHVVSISPWEETWRLEGCFCGIKIIRKLLQNEIRKKQAQENVEQPPSADNTVGVVKDPQAHQENGIMETRDLNGVKAAAPVDKPIVKESEMEQNKDGKRPNDQYRNDEKLDFQQRKETVESIPWVTNSGNSKDHDAFETEGKSKDAKSSENLALQTIYPDLSALKTDDHSPKRQRKLVENSQNEKLIKDENKGVYDGHNAGRRDDLKNDETTNYDKYSEHPEQRERYQDLATSKYDDHKENRPVRHETKDKDSANSPGLQENQTSDLERDRICALMTLPSVDIDKLICCYLTRHHIRELSRISDKCNVFEQYNFGQGQKLAIEVKPQYDTESVIEEFRKLYGQTIVDNVKIPEGVDLESLRISVEAIVEFKKVELQFMIKERICKIICSYRDLDTAKKDLLDVIKSSREFDASTNKKTRFNVENAPTHKDPTRTGPVYTATASIEVNQPRRSIIKILTEHHDCLLLSAANSMTIEIKVDDLSRVHDVDVVVSYIDHQLDIDGPMAVQIMSAAGPRAKTELLNYKQPQSFLHTSYLVHTSAGNLSGVKAIIHVVRPKVHEFPPYDQRSMDALRKVFTNCLSYTNDVLKLKSISLPPVGFGVYGAQMVVDSLLDAVETFASTVNHGNPSAAAQHRQHRLNYIQLISNERFCIGQLIQCIKQRL